MKPSEWEQLDRGDLIRDKSGAHYVVNDRVFVILKDKKVVHGVILAAINPSDWTLVRRGGGEYTQADFERELGKE